jgi:cell division protease FtsH
MSQPEAKNKIPPLGFNPLILWVGLIIFFIVSSYYTNTSQDLKTYTEFIELVEKDQVKEVVLDEERILAKLKDESKNVIAYRVEDEGLIPLLKSKGVKLEGSPKTTFWRGLALWVFPLLLFFFLFRNIFAAQGSRLMSFNKSKAKLYMEKDIKASFADVAGVDEAKEELMEVVNFLKDPKKYSRLGGRAPKGVLLVGPPGTGKTLMARAVAGEASVPFFSINGSEFVELFVGMGASRVRDLFEQARKNSPCIIFIDELDALGKARALGGFAGANDEKEQTLNQLLAELDGFDSTIGVILLAATNRPEILDPALLRAGRFDRQVLLDNPDQRGRLQILNIHAKNIKLEEGLKLEEVALMTPGFSGADLANLVNEAALIATRRNAEGVQLQDFVRAMERIVAGLERKQRSMNKDEKKRVAYHEMGHATVAMALEFLDRVQKVSIIPRGIGALGYTLQRPLEDRYLMTKEELKRKISVLLAGRVAEEKHCGDISTGAGDDLVKATNIARAMVTQYGMGQVLGLMSGEEGGSSRYLQGPAYQNRGIRIWSDSTEEKIDLEVKALLDECRVNSEKVLNDNSQFVEICVNELMQKETLDATELARLWKAHKGVSEKTSSPSILPKI